MGHEKKLTEQMHNRFAKMFERGYGRSRHLDKKNCETQGKIYSKNTFETYKKVGYSFVAYMRNNHPELKKLEACQAYVNEYLCKRAYTDKVSAWTFKNERTALKKLFGLENQPVKWLNAPKCERAEVTRSRGAAVRDTHFSETKNADLVEFCRSTGLRRHELQALRGCQFKDGFLIGVKGKGGKVRDIEIVGDVALVERLCKAAGKSKVWKNVHNAADVHSYRADYARRVYRRYERDSSHLLRSDMYLCRKDKKGRVLDREAMKMVSQNLGHERISVCAQSYL